MFTEFLETHKKYILSSLHDVLAHQKSNSINSWGTDATNRLEEFCAGGKMLRGSLVYLGNAISQNKEHPDVIKIATALELFQAGLLIHDDVMDHDKLRRGKASMHTQYTNLFAKHAIQNSESEGINFAMCVGDLAFFYAYELLGLVEHPNVIRYASRVLSHTVQAQMQDTYFGSTPKIPSSDDIMSLYHYKTGEYSITLPIVLGAMLGNASSETVHHLELFGKHLGIAYQLIDDRLNLYGDTDITGKPVGSDITNGKKTLYYHLISQSQEGKNLLESNNIHEIKSYCINTNIDEKITKHIEQHTKEAKEALFHVPLPQPIREIMSKCILYLTNRTS